MLKIPTSLIGLSATPESAEREFLAPVHNVAVDEDVRQFETKEEYNYSNLEYLIESMPKGKIGLIYVAHIRQIKRLVEVTKAKGLRSIAVCSIKKRSNFSKVNFDELQTYNFKIDQYKGQRKR